MPQVIAPPISGIDLGFAGSTGGRVRLLVGTGDPNVSATDNSNGDIASAAIGSLFLRNDGPDSTHCHYIKTALGNAGSPGTWTAK
jgi:hypothetical protein